MAKANQVGSVRTPSASRVIYSTVLYTQPNLHSHLHSTVQYSVGDDSVPVRVAGGLVREKLLLVEQ